MIRRYIATENTEKLLTKSRPWIQDGTIIMDFEIEDIANYNNVDASEILATLHEIEPKYPCVYLDIDSFHNDPQARMEYCDKPMTAGELIKALKNLGEDSLVFFRGEGSYRHLYGSVHLTDIDEGWTTDDEWHIRAVQRRQQNERSIHMADTHIIPNEDGKLFATEEGRRILMKRYGNYKHPYAGENENGERVLVSINPDSIVIETLQANGWVRKNTYDAYGLSEGETFSGRYK